MNIDVFQLLLCLILLLWSGQGIRNTASTTIKSNMVAKEGRLAMSMQPHIGHQRAEIGGVSSVHGPVGILLNHKNPKDCDFLTHCTVTMETSFDYFETSFPPQIGITTKAQSGTHWSTKSTPYHGKGLFAPSHKLSEAEFHNLNLFIVYVSNRE